MKNRLPFFFKGHSILLLPHFRIRVGGERASKSIAIVASATPSASRLSPGAGYQFGPRNTTRTENGEWRSVQCPNLRLRPRRHTHLSQPFLPKGESRGEVLK